MRLDSYLPLIRGDAGYAALRDQLATARAARFSALEAAKPAVLAALHAELRRPTILLVSRLARGRQLAEELGAWTGRPEAIHLFPELDPLPYERLAPGPEPLYDRLRAMLALASASESGGPAPLVIVTTRGAADRIMTPAECRATTWRLKVGERIRPDRLVAEWVAAGYEPVSIVEGPGEFARRGGILDIFPTQLQIGDFELRIGDGGVAATVGGPDLIRNPQSAIRNASAAFRIELWGNDVDSIRVFDPATQRSAESVQEIVIGPAHEVRPALPEGAEELLGELDVRHASSRLQDEIEDELRQLREGQPFPRLEWWRGVLGHASILDYLPDDGLLIVDEPGAIAAMARQLHRQAEETYVDLIERGEAPGHAPRPYWTWEELESRLAHGAPQSALPGVVSQARTRLDLVLDPDALNADFVPAPTYSGRLGELRIAEFELRNEDEGGRSAERGVQNVDAEARDGGDPEAATRDAVPASRGIDGASAP
ncbi:MAG: hypothetical protein QOF51_3709, partial [Chloroflexota bacterium]|nr:hypothetical protein [Chloroflexota bacterium]